MSYFKETPCGHCKKALRYSDSQLGAKVRCPKCGNSVTLGLPAVPGAQNPQAHIDKPNRPVGAPVSAKGKPGWVKDVKDLAGVVPPTPTGRTEVFETAKPAGKVSNDAWADPNATGVPPLPSSPPPGNYTLVRRVAIGLSAAAMIGLLATGTWWFKTSAAGAGQMQTQSGPAKTVGGDAQQPPAGGAQPQTPPTPQPPPNTPPTPPKQPEPPPAPPQDQNALDPKRSHAEQVEVKAEVEGILFASSIIGMRDFDKRYFESLPLEESSKKYFDEVIENDGTPAVSDSEEFSNWVINGGSGRHKGIWEQRPMLTVAFPAHGLPNGVRVGVYAEALGAEGKRLTGISEGALVSKTDSVPVRADISQDLKSAVDFNQDKDQFEVQLFFPWNYDELLMLKKEASFEVLLKVVYADKSSDIVKERITIKPARELEQYPGCAEFGMLIDKDHPWVRKIINQINQASDVKGHDIHIDAEDADGAKCLMAIYYLWKDLKSRGIRYQSMTNGERSQDAEGKVHIAQRIRPIHEAMSDQNANCADGTILFASFLEAMGFDPLLVFAPSHVYVAASFQGKSFACFNGGKASNYVFAIETTWLAQTPKVCPKLWGPYAEMADRYPFVKKDPAFWSFVDAIDNAGVKERAQNLSASTEQYKRFLALQKALEPDPKNEEVLRQIRTLRDEWIVHFEVPVSKLRGLGVRAVGAPSSVDRDFVFPSSKR